jgi:hypothetical protein
MLTGKKIMDTYTPKDIEKIVVMERLRLHNQGLQCGAQVIHRNLSKKGIEQLPSVRTIGRILSRNYLTYRRTGYYPEDYDDL